MSEPLLGEVRISEKGISLPETAPISRLHFFHRWTIWKTTKQGILEDRKGHKIGLFECQERRCVKCKKVELREART